MEFEERNPGGVPPAGVTYEQWTECAHKNALATMGRSTEANAHSSANCAELTSGPGLYLADNIWSPRRGLAAAVLQQKVRGFRCPSSVAACRASCLRPARPAPWP